MATVTESPSVNVELLGPLRLFVDDAQVEVPGPKRRAVLALLALAEGRAVTAEELLDALWPSNPPAADRAALHSHISRLRGHLGPAAPRLEAVSGSYRLRLAPEELDVSRARARLADARACADAEPAEAYAGLREARELWRGPPLTDLAEILPIAARSVALDELRREVNDLLVECGIAAGEAASVVGVAAEAVAEEPLRESSVMLLMQALAAAGRTVDALRAAFEYRQALKQDAGLDPSPALGEMERVMAGSGSTPVRRAGSLPNAVMPLVGRDSEVAALQRLLADERLVTVVGPGGVGKTRVAVEVARRHDEVTFLGLAPVTDAQDMPHALAAALELEAVRGDPLGACIALLGSGAQLLVVDNCEHLLDAVRTTLTVLLESCPQLVVLATSRERLGLAAERQVRLGPLAVPSDGSDHPEQAPATAVFLDRARRVRPGFAPSEDDIALIADIVRHLDGLPLSIELAAGRLSSFSVVDLHARLDRSLDLLEARAGSTDARHQTLRATLEWSYDLLAELEQRLFRNLAVFPDGVDLGTAEMVAADVGVPGDVASTFSRLVDASMLDAELQGTPRYRMLETVRSYGLDRLGAAGERDEADERLLRWAVALAQWIDAALHTTDEALVNAQLRRELPNLRAAWGRARRDDVVDHAIELVVALDDVAQWRDLPELWRWADDLSQDPRVEGHPRAAAALAAASDAAWLLGRLERAGDLAEQALDRASDDDGRWRALLATAVVHLSRADYAAAIAEALEAAALSPRPAHANWVAALAAAYAGDLDRAREVADRGKATSPTLRAEEEYVAGEIASIAGRTAQAEQHYEYAIELARDVGATFVVGIASVGLLTVRARARRFEDALRGYFDLISYWERAGNWIQVWTTLRNLAALLRMLGDEERALYLEAAANHAPESPLVSHDAWQDDADGAAHELSPTRAAAIRAEVIEMTPTMVLDVARGAIEAHLRTMGASTSAGGS